MTNSDQKNETYSEAETEARREATLKKLLSTPPKPHKTKKDERDGKGGNSKPVS
jgi:hypothetical protein